jgi:hypothetical protein
MPWIANWIASETALQTNEIPFVLAKPAIGVWGYCPQGLAGVFSGDVSASQDMTVTGTFAAATKLFKIDHPLDPANKYYDIK